MHRLILYYIIEIVNIESANNVKGLILMNKIAINDGVWPVMLTPFTSDNKIDYNGVMQIIEYYDKAKVDGILAVCQSSEMFFLDIEERVELARFVVENTPKHINVVASGHTASTIEQQIEDAKRIIDTGIKSYVFISNQFAKEGESEDVAKKSIDRLLENIPGDAFGIYECPVPYKRLISPELLKWLADTGKFSYLKDTCCDADQIKQKLKAVEGTDLKIYNANAATLLDTLNAGISGYSGIMANFHPELYVWLCKNFKKYPKEASQLQDVLGAASMVECQIYPVNAKYHMTLEGLDITTITRVRNNEQLPSSRKLEIEQFNRAMNMFKESFLDKFN